jgi:hypothetical protein
MTNEYLKAMELFNLGRENAPQKVIQTAEDVLKNASYDDAEYIFKTAPYDYFKTKSLERMLNEAKTEAQVHKVFNGCYVGSALFNKASRRLDLFETASSASL